MDKKLTIIIAGDTNAGKSTMMLQLEKLLTENGYNVELSFHGEPDYSGENAFHFHNKESQNFAVGNLLFMIQRLKALKRIQLLD